MAVMAGRMAQFPSEAMTAVWHAPGSGEGRVDEAVPGCASDGVVPMVEEEWDNAVPGGGGEGRVNGAVPRRGDGVEAVGVVVVSKRE
jgi:hypothetical protein